MDNNGISNVSNPVAPQDVVTLAALEILIERSIQYSMTSTGRDARGTDLDMDRHKIINLPLQPTENSEAVSKYYVDSGRTKPIITIWAAERGSLVNGRYEWSFVHGAEIQERGYPMMVSGRILRTTRRPI